MGTRARARSRAAAPRRQSAGNAPASRDSRASVRDTQNADGRNALPDETTAQGRHRDGVARARLQSHASDEYHRCPTAPGGDEGIVALVCCLRTQRTGKDGLAHPGGPCREGKSPGVRNGKKKPNSPKSRCITPLPGVFAQPRPEPEVERPNLL